jgi:hypothetical protein
MKSRKRIKSAPVVELEDEEDTIVQVCHLAYFFHALNLFQPISRGVPEVVLP